MKLDNEQQRQVLVQVIDAAAPRVVQDAGPQSLEQLRVLSEVRAAVQGAGVEQKPSKEPADP